MPRPGKRQDPGTSFRIGNPEEGDAIPPVDAALASALTLQLQRRDATLVAGAERVGWKLGMGDRERIGDSPVIGHLTSATRLPPGATYAVEPDEAVGLHADAEVALELSRDIDADASTDEIEAAIAGFGAALELVDLRPVEGGAPRIVETNVFHRAFALGTLDRPPPRAATGRLIVNGQECASAAADGDYVALTAIVARLLGAVGERLHAGDRLITGSVVQVPVTPGDAVVADLGPLGRVQLSVASNRSPPLR